MKRLLAVALLMCSAAWAQTTPPSNAVIFADNDDNSNWLICSGSCAGGASPIQANFYLNQQPALDGGSIEFYILGRSWTDVLFYHPLGAHNSLSNFQTDFYFQLSSSSATLGQAFEFDTYQFINNVTGALGPVEFMFGTQCDYGKNGGVWDIWNQDQGAWIPRYDMPCVNPGQPKFTPNIWYRITWNFHRTAPGTNLPYGGLSYDSVRILEYGNGVGSTATSDHTYTLNTVEAAGALPAGWSDQLGVQFQIDFNGQAHKKASITEYADKITLTAW